MKPGTPPRVGNARIGLNGHCWSGCSDGFPTRAAFSKLAVAQVTLQHGLQVMATYGKERPASSE
jgi:hypothetical protein